MSIDNLLRIEITLSNIYYRLLMLEIYGEVESGEYTTNLKMLLNMLKEESKILDSYTIEELEVIKESITGKRIETNIDNIFIYDIINRLEKNLRIGRTTKNGYVRQVYADSLMIKGEDFADWFHLASNNFYFEQYKGKLRIICLGKGNGLGMSQYGAGTMAKTGKSYKKILKYYYPKTRITNLYE